MLTFLDLRKLVAQYAGQGGSCFDSKDTELFALRVMEYVQKKGAYGSIRRFKFVAQKGAITLPSDLEVPLQVRIGGVVGSVWNPWQTFQSVSGDLDNCVPAFKVLNPSPNPAFSMYEVPAGGSKLGIIANCLEDSESSIIIQGKDITGRTIVTYHKGEEIVGEKFSLKKGILSYGQAIFGEITGIIKSKTKGYISLYAVNPDTKASLFLSDYAPFEETPSYTRVTVSDCNSGALTEVMVQGRIRLKTLYADNEIIPFDSINTLVFAAENLGAENRGAIDIARHKGQLVNDFIENDAAYRRVAPGTPINVVGCVSGSAVKGIVRNKLWGL